MSFIKDMAAINKVVLKKTNQTYIHNLRLIPVIWLYIFVYAIYSGVLMLLASFTGQAGDFIANIAIWFGGSFLVSDYLHHLNGALVGEKFHIRDMKTGGLRYFYGVLALTAIPNIINFLLGSVTGFSIPTIIVMLIHILFATPEMVYQKDRHRVEIFIDGFHYFKENWQQWTLVNSILSFVAFLFYNGVSRLVYSIFINLSFSSNLVDGYVASIIFLVFVWGLVMAFVHYAMIYRGYLFKVLSVSTYRKREYMRNIYGK